MKIYKQLFLTLLIMTTVAYRCKGRMAQESTQLISKRIIKSEREQLKIFDEMYKQRDVIKKKIKEFKDFRDNQQGLYGYGRIQRLEALAERYQSEKLARETIENETMKLLNLMTKLDELQKKTAEDKRILELRNQIMDLKGIDEATLALPAEEDQLFYYELKAPATYKEVSALPEVYNDADSWRYLYEANKDKFKDPLEVIPVGAELVVPNIKVVEPIDITGDK